MWRPNQSECHHQPNFLPWVGFWHKFLSADVFVICTGTKYTRKSYGNRVIMADNYSWATIPTARGGLLYKDVKILTRSIPTAGESGVVETAQIRLP